MQVSSTGQVGNGYQLVDDSHQIVFEDINRKLADKFEMSVVSAVEVIRDFANTVESYVDINAYNNAIKEVKKNEGRLGRFSAKSLLNAEKYSVHSTLEIKDKALNFCTDDLSLVTDEELKYQLKLEEGFGEIGASFERLLIDGGWAAYPELFKTDLAKSIDGLRPGCLALVMQETFSEIIESTQVVRMLYRFVGCNFFESAVDVYEVLLPVLRDVSKNYAMPQPSTIDNSLLENDSAESLEAFFSGERGSDEKKSTTVDVTGLINNWDVPCRIDGEDQGSISDIDLDQLTPDTTIQTLEKNDVAKLLDKLAFTKKLAGEDVDSPESVRGEIKEALAQLSGEGMLTVIDRVSENIVNLVSHLFDDIVHADNLISEVSLQISRAQLPVMRLALSDTKLFQTADHPVRQYINRLGELGLKITDPEERGFDKIKESVDELLESFDSNNNIYGELLSGLDTFINTSNYSSLVVDDGLSSEDFQVENQNRAALDFLTKQHAMLENELVFHKFLKVVWGAVLSRISMSIGVDSNAWNEATGLYTVIIQSTQMESGIEGKRQILRKLPKIMIGVRKTFDDYQLNDDVRNSLLDQMMFIHLNIIRGIDGKNIVDEANTANSLTTAMAQDSIASTDSQNINNINKNTTTSPNAVEDQVAPISDLSNAYKHCLSTTKEIDFGESVDIDVLVDRWEEGDKPDDRAVFRVDDKVTPVEFKQSSNRRVGLKEDNKVIVAREDKANLIRETFLQVGRMVVGSLIECEEEGVSVRYQLTHKSTIFGKYTFNDFKRRKTWLLTKPELVMELARGRAKAISAPKLFDDTLESVVTQLQAQRM
ncbi:MAG: DUF1631 family protein [Pseudomonadales bacterium]|nr:DUF1631 family protein [Pseudomonadales bacterium]